MSKPYYAQRKKARERPTPFSTPVEGVWIGDFERQAMAMEVYQGLRKELVARMGKMPTISIKFEPRDTGVALIISSHEAPVLAYLRSDEAKAMASGWGQGP